MDSDALRIASALYEAGKAAYLAGLGIESCPHPWGYWGADWWRDGWRAGRREGAKNLLHGVPMLGYK